MQFELTEALVDDILFSMEDQNGKFVLDTVNGVVSAVPDGDGGSRYISLPGWDSSSGFRLMERFAAGFKNPLIRKELCGALDRGRGVFRAFKDSLGRRPEVEKLWFAYKKQEMRREIILWYNGLREEWGLKKIGMEPEETGDLLLEDFRFRPFSKEDMDKAGELHRRCLEESGADSAVGLLRPLSDTPETGLAAETGGGDFAGYITGSVKDGSLYIENLEVKAEFRGLGIGQTLLARFLESFDRSEVRQVFFDLPSSAENFTRALLRESFKPYTVRYRLKR